MAHFLEYKTPAQVTTYLVDFSDLLGPADTGLDLQKCKDALVVLNSAGEDKKAYLVQSMSAANKVLSLVLVNGISGEDYTLSIRGIGDVDFLTYQAVRVLELRVRDKLVGNL